jgi:hypothetical protein
MESIGAVIEAIERAPRVVVPLVREVPTAHLKRRPTPGKWSAHEHACHLAVVHRLFFERLDLILASPAPVITPYDPGTEDPDDALLRLDLEESLASYVHDRTGLVARLRTLSEADWRRTAEQRRVQPLFRVHHVPPPRAPRFFPCVSDRGTAAPAGVEGDSC